MQPVPYRLPLQDAGGLQRPQAAAAFTLVELLVTIAIIGVLVGLLIPGVQSARESARRTSCANNLKQIGTGLHSFINVNKGALPAGEMNAWGTGASGGAATFDHGSVTMYLLPFIEQQPLFDGYDMRKYQWTSTTFPVPGPTNSWAMIPGTSRYIAHTSIPTYLCPSDTVRSLPQSIGTAYAGAGYANRGRLNYVGCWGPRDLATTPECPAIVTAFNASATTNQKRGTGSIQQPGVFSHFQYTAAQYSNYPSMDAGRTKISEILDGLSKTICFGESRPNCSFSLFIFGWGGSGNTTGRGTTLVPINYDTCDQGPMNDGVPNCRKPFNGNWLSQGFRSAHPGGAAFLFCDGRIAFLEETIDHPTYQRLGAKADGEMMNTY